MLWNYRKYIFCSKLKSELVVKIWSSFSIPSTIPPNIVRIKAKIQSSHCFMFWFCVIRKDVNNVCTYVTRNTKQNNLINILLFFILSNIRILAFYHTALKIRATEKMVRNVCLWLLLIFSTWKRLITINSICFYFVEEWQRLKTKELKKFWAEFRSRRRRETSMKTMEQFMLMLPEILLCLLEAKIWGRIVNEQQKSF